MTDLDGLAPPPHAPTASEGLALARADVLAEHLGEHALSEMYLYLFHRRSAHADDLVRAGFDADVVPTALDVLFTRGLIAPGEGEIWEIVPPSRSLPALAARLEERARLVRASLPGLTSAYRAAAVGDGEGFDGIEFLPTTRDVGFAITQCFTQSPTGVKAMRRDSIASRNATFAAMPSLRQGRVGVTQTVECTTVLHTELVSTLDPAELDVLNGAPRERLLLSGRVPFTAVVSPSGSAVVEVVVGESSEGFRVNRPELVASVAATIDLVIETATPWQDRANPEKVGGGLSESEQEILHLLSLGVPDPTIARRLGISSRTFDRRLRSILDTLGAVTRFQAGVIAARRGWL